MDSSKDHKSSPSDKNTGKGKGKGKENDADQVYRLLPVEESQAYEYGSIHFTDLLKYYWNKRRIVYWSAGIFLAIGIFFAFFSPAEYTSRASIIPEYELQDKVDEVIESYGLLFGLSGSIQEKRTPSYLLELYPYMINSISFQQSLIRKPFSYGKSDAKITLHEYFTEIHRPTFMHTVRKYTLELPGTIAGALKSDLDAQAQSPADSSYGPSLDDTSATPMQQNSPFQIVHFNPGEKAVISQMQNRISAGYQRRTGIVDIQADMPDPELAAKVIQITLEVLQDKVVSYKTGKGRIYKKFLLGQQAGAKKELDQAREELTNFRDTDSQPLNQRMELQSRYEHILDRYNTLTQQVERVELTIQEQLPAFRILDDITVPSQKSEPNRKLILTFSLLLGFLIAICWITITFFASTLSSKLSS